MTRRLSLALALGGGLLCISGVMCARNTADPSFTLKAVGPNVWAAISNPTSTTAAGANTGFVIGDDSVAVIDATLSGDADGNLARRGFRDRRSDPGVGRCVIEIGLLSV